MVALQLEALVTLIADISRKVLDRFGLITQRRIWTDQEIVS